MNQIVNNLWFNVCFLDVAFGRNVASTAPPNKPETVAGFYYGKCSYFGQLWLQGRVYKTIVLGQDIHSCALPSLALLVAATIGPNTASTTLTSKLETDARFCYGGCSDSGLFWFAEVVVQEIPASCWLQNVSHSCCNSLPCLIPVSKPHPCFHAPTNDGTDTNKEKNLVVGSQTTIWLHRLLQLSRLC